MWEVVRSILKEDALSLSLALKVQNILRYVRRRYFGNVSTLFFVGLIGWWVIPAVLSAVEKHGAEQILFPSLAHLVLLMMLIQAAMFKHRNGACSENLHYTFYAAGDHFAASRVVWASLCWAPFLCLDGLLIGSYLFMEHHLSFGITLFLLALLLTRALSTLALVLLLQVLKLKIPYLGILFVYLVYLIVGVVLIHFNLVGAAFLLWPGEWVATLSPFVWVYEVVAPSMSAAPWLKLVPAGLLLLGLPLLIRSYSNQYRLFEEVPCPFEALGDEAFDETDEELEGLNLSDENLELLEGIRKERSPLGAFNLRTWIANRCYRFFSLRERVMLDFLFGEKINWLSGLRYTSFLLLLLAGYRLVAEFGWVTQSMLVPVLLAVAAIAPWFSVATRVLPSVAWLAGRQMPQEIVFPVAADSIAKICLKRGYIRMLLGLPFVVVAWVLIPFDWEPDLITFKHHSLLFWLAWFLLLPVAYCLQLQTGFMLSRRKGSFFLGTINFILFIGVGCLVLATLGFAFFNLPVAAVLLVVSWLSAGLIRLLFLTARKNGFYDFRMKIQQVE